VDGLVGLGRLFGIATVRCWRCDFTNHFSLFIAYCAGVGAICLCIHCIATALIHPPASERL
jgi:hypothetical protein